MDRAGCEGDGDNPRLRLLAAEEIASNVKRSPGAAALLEKGEIDRTVSRNDFDAPRLEANENLRLRVVPSTRQCYVAMNHTVPALAHVNGRKALNYAIDKDGIVEDVKGAKLSLNRFTRRGGTKGDLLEVDNFPASFSWLDQEAMKRQGIRRQPGYLTIGGASRSRIEAAFDGGRVSSDAGRGGSAGSG